MSLLLVLRGDCLSLEDTDRLITDTGGVSLVMAEVCVGMSLNLN